MATPEHDEVDSAWDLPNEPTNDAWHVSGVQRVSSTSAGEALVRAAEDIDDEGERTAALSRAARVLTEEGSFDRAVTVWEQVLTLCPDHLAGLQEQLDLKRLLGDTAETVDAIARTLRRAGRLLGEDEVLALTRELVDLHLAAEDFAEAAEALAQVLTLVTDADARQDLFRRIAALLAGELDDADQAFDVLLSGLDERIGDAHTLGELEGLARRTGRVSELLSVVAAHVVEPAVEGDRTLCVRLLSSMARWYEDDLGRPDFAVTCLEKAKALGLYDVGPAISLGRLQRAQGLAEDALATQTHAFERAVEPAQRRHAAIELGELLELAGDHAAAARTLEQAMNGDETDRRVLRALSRLYPTLGVWAELRTVLEMRLDRVESDDERVEVLLALAEVQDTHFLFHERAAELYEQVLELSPDHPRAITALPGCYTRARLWDAAVHAHERALEIAVEPEARAGAFASIARICVSELGVVDRGVEAYEHALSIDPDHLPSLEALARLYDRRGEHQSALATLRRLAELTWDSAAKVELLWKMALVCDQKLGDADEARSLLNAALRIDPDFLPALGAARRLATEAGELAEVARLLEREQRGTQNVRARARMLAELGALRAEQDPSGAEQAFTEAIALDPENEQAAWPLAQIWFERGELSRAEPLLERLARAPGRRDRAEKNLLFSMYGRALSAAGKHARALTSFRSALSADPSDAESLRGYAEAAFRAGDRAAAIDAHKKLLVVLGEEDQELRADALYRLGSMHGDLGDMRKAQSHLERALEARPGHRDSLRALAVVHEAKQDLNEAIACRRALVDAATDADERRRLLCELADACERKGDPANAAIAIDEALLSSPDDRRLLLRLLKLHEAAADWAQVADTVERLVAREEDPNVAAKYLTTAALVHEEKLGDVDCAASCLERAMLLDPKRPERLERLLGLAKRSRKRDDAWLARIHRRLLERLEETPNEGAERRFELWRTLGELCRRRGDLEGAIEAFAQTSNLRPRDPGERCALAAVLHASGRSEQAIRELRAAIERDPRDPRGYRMLFAIHARTGLVDRAFCAASALVTLGKADAEHHECFETLRTRAVPPFRAAVDDATFQSLVASPRGDAVVDGILRVITRAACAEKRRANAAMTMWFEGRQAPETSDHPIARLFFGGARILGLAAPELYVRSDLPGGLGLLPTEPTASLLGSTLLSGFTVTELAYVVGEHLVVYRQQPSLAALFPTPREQRELLLAAIALGGGAVPSEPAIRSTAAILADKITESERSQLMELVALLPDDPIDTLRAGAITAARAGLVLAGDLLTASRMIKQQPVPPGAMSPSEKIDELLCYVVSDEYSALRARLGIALADDLYAFDDGPTRERKVCA